MVFRILTFRSAAIISAKARADISGNLHNNLNNTDLTGEYEDRNFVVTRGDSRIAMTIAKNEDTVRFNRESRFLIDDPESQIKLSYLLTKPLKVGWVYNTEGVYSFVLQEVVSTDDDNHELGIADYYKYFPKDSSPTQPDNDESIVDPENNIDEDGRQVWL